MTGVGGREGGSYKSAGVSARKLRAGRVPEARRSAGALPSLSATSCPSTDFPGGTASPPVSLPATQTPYPPPPEGLLLRLGQTEPRVSCWGHEVRVHTAEDPNPGHRPQSLKSRTWNGKEAGLSAGVALTGSCRTPASEPERRRLLVGGQCRGKRDLQVEDRSIA